MAHRTPGRKGRLRAAGLGASACLAILPALALDVGEPQVRSALGEPLDASLPVKAARGERFAGKCFSVAPGMGMPDDPGLGVTLERSLNRSRLRVRTGKPIDEPAVGLRVGVDCEKSGKPLKDVPLLIDPPTRPARTAKPGNAEGDVAAEPLPSAAHELAAQSPPKPSPPPKAAAPRKESAPRAKAVSPASEAPAVPARPAPPARPGGGGFQLKLTTGEMDLAPSRRVDDKQREQLRGRLALLDADDQLSAMLAMRHQLQALESKVASLQLKIATMPESFPPPKAAKPAEAPKPAPVVEAPKPAPVVEAPKPAPVVEAPKPAPAVEVPKPAPVVEAPKPAPVVEAPKPAPVVEAPKPAPVAEAPKPVESPKAKSAVLPRPAAPPQRNWADEITSSMPAWALPLAGILLVLVALAWFWRRRRANAVEEVAEVEASEDVFEVDAEDAPPPDLPLGEIAEPIELAQRPEDVSPPPTAPAPAPISAPAPAAARLDMLADDAASLRHRYIAERFPEVAAGSIDLADPESVVKGARLFYEDGELPRAVELLQYTIESAPEDPRPWLALFEIFRLERLGGEFSTLAARFKERFGDSEWWSKVRFFGREVDPGNALYRDEVPATLETIGPREARRLAAQNATYDPVTENWLRAPMDFQNEVLATELRRALMSDAALAESDLVPNPMPALRDIEMFTVA